MQEILEEEILHLGSVTLHTRASEERIFVEAMWPGCVNLHTHSGKGVTYVQVVRRNMDGPCHVTHPCQCCWHLARKKNYLPFQI